MALVLLALTPGLAWAPQALANGGDEHQVEELLDEDGFLGLVPGRPFVYADAVARLGNPSKVEEVIQTEFPGKLFTWDQNPSPSASLFRAVTIFVVQETYPWKANRPWLINEITVGAAYSIRPAAHGVTDNRKVQAYLDAIPGSIAIEAENEGHTETSVTNLLPNLQVSFRDDRLVSLSLGASELPYWQKRNDAFRSQLKRWSLATTQIARQSIAEDLAGPHGREGGQNILLQGSVLDACRQSESEVLMLVDLPAWSKSAPAEDDSPEARSCLPTPSDARQALVSMRPGASANQIQAGDRLVLVAAPTGRLWQHGDHVQVEVGNLFPLALFKKDQPIPYEASLATQP